MLRSRKIGDVGAVRPHYRAGMAPPDALDRLILEQLQIDATVAAREIGDAIGLSAAAVQRRIKRMRTDGVIRRIVAEVDPRTVERPITCVVSVELEHEGSEQIDELTTALAAHADVQQIYYVTGSADLILTVLMPDMEAYDTFTRRFFLDDPNVRSFTTHVALDRIKTGTTVGVGPPPHSS